ncbi:amino acid/polyamine/organocation transporter, APC superfamily (TC 2.A.3) [Vibrio gazogenes DSM 21264]|uniref:Amino acid/polyamine/organocation transporter, APC superfamily (TC 2.A.3) n=2 Tax=Vibrio gazogenes TaxID=687 RepID=A0A1M4TWS9_VIBGA|nr:amino acid/polyamine/organocation transporter, APC superfamily (TC 2.A.3) [Vibrio gazogenes DSM 21264] [Vibrio gazogenes DSM 21264 = NBRC 103151]SJN53063.1 putative glutamate/gamma-aminobutyrate antiporter [Vibrio gazogenes]
MTEKKMGITPLALFSLCAVLVVDTLTASASIGVSSLGWWVLILAIFVLPYGLITSELSSAYPGEGGIYDWVKRAFGVNWAIRTTWFYWINVGLWMPAVYILFAGMFAELFAPDLSLMAQVIICVVLTWGTVWMCNISTDIGVLITNFCAVLKVVIISVLGIGGFIYAAKNGVANEFSLAAIMPSFNSGIAFLPALVFNLMGFELVATMTREMKDVKQMPKVVFLAIGITSLLYIVGTLGILMALPVKEVGLVAGIVDTLKVLFGDGELGQFMTYALGVVTLITFIGNMVSWTMGSSRAAAESAREGELPAIVGKTSAKHATPVGANTITGLVSTAVILIYALFANTNDELFWSMFAFSSCIFLMPYLLMFPAYLKLRMSDASAPRPFQVPGNMGVQKTITVVCFLIILQAVVLFIFPDIIFGSIDWQYTLPVLLGVLATIAVGEVLLQRTKRQASPLTGEEVV